MKYLLRFTFGGIMLLLAMPFIFGCLFFNLWNWNQKGNYVIEDILSSIDSLIKNR